MDLFEKIRKYENLHIVFWLMKDTCWMLELKWLGAVMVVPTLTLCVLIIYKTRMLHEVWINWAIFFWICANSFWMLMEFFGNPDYKYFAAIPFSLGFFFVFLFYVRPFMKGKAQ